MAQAIFASGMLLGGAGGQALGGILGARYGWQYALFVVAVAGLVPAIAVSSLQEPPCGPSCETVPISRILRVPAFGVMLAGGACISFASGSILPRSEEHTSELPSPCNLRCRPLLGKKKQ